jgi:hypothetical protein
MSWRDIVRKEEKPDYIDIDGDGNKTESMKEAAKDKRESPASKDKKRRKAELGRMQNRVKSKNPFTRND